jgi:hypothetical protein
MSPDTGGAADAVERRDDADDTPSSQPPPEVAELARERASARAERRFADADALRARIEEAGWKPVDRGLGWTLEPLHPPDVRMGERVAYGASTHVPSRLEEPARAGMSIVAVVDAGHGPGALAALAPQGDRGDPEVIVVVDGPPRDVDPTAGLPTERGLEVVRMSTSTSPGVALNAGLRRTTGTLVLTFAPGITPTADILRPAADALADPDVGIVGGRGLRTRDLRHYEPGPPGDAEALDGAWLCFRREDLRLLGPLDEGYHGLRHLAIWWSLRLRDRGPGTAPRRAVALDVPLAGSVADVPDERAMRRDHYRLIRAFGRRRDLVLPS